MKSTKVNQETTSPVVNEVSSEKELKHVKVPMTEQDRIVPVVIFACHDLTVDGHCSEPGPYEDFDIWDQGIGCNVQPISNVIRVLIRPDVPKKIAQKILKKLIRIIGQDKYDWPQETDNFLNNWKREIEANRRNKDKSIITSG